MITVAVVALANSIAPGALYLAAQSGSRIPPPERQSRSRIEVSPSEVTGRERGAMLNSFSNCVQTNKSNQVEFFLRNSDDLKYSDRIRDLKKFLALEYCIADGAHALITEVGARFQVQNLRGWLAEQAYKSKHRSMPDAVGLQAPSAARQFFSKGQNLALARARSDFADCIARENLSGADALVRTPWGGSEERTASRALAPTLGQCLPEGQSLSLQIESVRMFAAVGLWQQHVETMPASTKGQP